MYDFYGLVNQALAIPESPNGLLGSAILLVSLIVWSGRRSTRIRIRANYGDLAAVLYVAVQCATLTVSTLRSNTIHFIIPYIFALNMYLAVRLLGQYPLWSTSILVRGMLVVSLLVAIGDLSIQVPSIQSARLRFPAEALSSIRATLPILGGPTRNDGLAVALCLLPYACAAGMAHRHSNRVLRFLGTITVGILTAVLVLGFSRSIYIVFILATIFMVTWAIRKRGNVGRTIGSLVLVGCIATAVTMCWTRSWKAVVATASGFRTVSEERSTLGRVTIWHETVTEILSHPILGHGGGVDGLLTLRRLANHDEPFTARAYNAALSVLLSSGIVGIACYGTMFGYTLISAFWTSTQQRRVCPWDNTRSVFALEICAIILRDMTYSSLVSCGTVITVTWIAIAILNNICCKPSKKGIARKSIDYLNIDNLGWAAVAIPLLILVPLICTARGDSAYVAACEDLLHGNYTEAHQGFTAAIAWDSKQPMFYVADALSLERQVIDTSSTEALSAIPSASGETQEHLLQNMRNDIVHALSESSDDASLWCDLGWTEILQGENRNARAAFAEAIKRDPRDPIALVSEAMTDPAGIDDPHAKEEYVAALVAYPRMLDSPWFSKLNAQHPSIARDITVRAYHLLLAQADSPIRSANLGKLYVYQNNRASARRELTRAVTALPNLTYAWANLGLVNLTESNPWSAREDFERARYLDESNRLATNMLAKMAYDDGDTDSAEQIYAEALLMPEQSMHAARVWRLYHVMPPLANDSIPEHILEYISPTITPVPLCDTLWLANVEANAGHSMDVATRLAGQESLCQSQQ